MHVEKCGDRKAASGSGGLPTAVVVCLIPCQMGRALLGLQANIATEAARGSDGSDGNLIPEHCNIIAWQTQAA